MVERARGREPQRACAHGVARERRHRAVILRRGRVAVRAAFTHDIDAQRRVRQLRANVYVEIALRQPVHVVRETFPRPGYARAKHWLRDILDAFHQLNQLDVISWTAGGETDAAIPHDGGGAAVLRRARVARPPGHPTFVLALP